MHAIFLLFNDGHLSFEELTQILSDVFRLFAKTVQMQGGEPIEGLDFDRLPFVTAEKCFRDLQIPKQCEINYQMFLQWIMGENMYDEDELEHLNRTAPPTKSTFAKKQFDDASEWTKRFMQEAEFIDKFDQIRREGHLEKVTLANAELRFRRYQEV